MHSRINLTNCTMEFICYNILSHSEALLHENSSRLRMHTCRCTPVPCVAKSPPDTITTSTHGQVVYFLGCEQVSWWWDRNGIVSFLWYSVPQREMVNGMVYSHCVCFGKSISVTVVTWLGQLELIVLYDTPDGFKFSFTFMHPQLYERAALGLFWGFFRMSTVWERNYRFYHKVVVHLILSVCDMTKQTFLKIIPDHAITAGVPIIDRD